MGNFSDLSVSMQMRDTIGKLVESVVDRIRPPYRYARVTQVSGTTNKATVIFVGDTNAVSVSYGSHMPMVGNIVRVDGMGTDKFITEIVGGSRSMHPGPVRYTSLSYQNSWTNYSGDIGGYHRGGVFKTSEGIVVLTGLVSGGAASTVLFNLPVGYRPDNQWVFNVLGSAGNTYLYVQSNGDVRIGGIASSGWVSLEGMMFPAAGVASWTAIGSGGSTWGTNWSSFHTQDSSYGVSSFWRDPLGRVWIQGMAKHSAPSVLAAASTMFTLPFATSFISHYPAFTGGGAFGCVIRQAGASTAVQAHVGANSAYVSTSRSFFVDANVRPSGDWITLPVHENAWVRYNAGYPDSCFMKFADGIVMQDGLIAGGTIATNSGWIPPGIRPDVQHQPSQWGSGKMIFGTVADLTLVRTDLQNTNVLPDSPGIYEHSGSTLWRSHGSINYLVAG